MKNIFRATLLLTCACLLTQCGQKQQPAQTPVDISIIGSRNALFWTEQLIQQSITGSAQPRPSAMLGAYVSAYLSGANAQYQSALQGVSDSLTMLTENTEHPDESFAILQALGTVLQVDIADMLNRSADRQQALNAYTDALQKLLDRSKAQVTALQQDLQTEQQDERTKQTAVNTIQNDLNQALQKQDYTTASSKQEQIVPAQADLATAQSKVTQTRSTINVFTNLNSIATERLAAIDANREVLIAGLHVVNVPGINNLGVLQNARGTSNSTQIFGPLGL